MALQRVEHDVEPGKTTAVGITGFGQQFAGLDDVVRKAGLAGVAGGIRRGETVGRRFSRTTDPGCDSNPVHRHGQRAADPFVIQRRFGDVEPVDVSAQVSVDAEQFGAIASVGIDLGERRFVGDMQLAGAKGAFLGVETFDRVETNLLQLDIVSVPIGRTLPRDQHVVDFPFPERERPVADKIFRARPAIAAPIDWAATFDDGNRNGKPGIVVQQR